MCLLRARSSLTFRLLQSVDSLWNVYVTWREHTVKCTVPISTQNIIYELSGSRFESSCSHLNFRFCTCFKQGVPWHSGNYKVWIHSEMHMWHDKNIQWPWSNELTLSTQKDIKITRNFQESNKNDFFFNQVTYFAYSKFFYGVSVIFWGKCNFQNSPH